MQMTHVSQFELASLTLYSAAVGVLLGLIYDVFRILRIAAEPASEPRLFHKRRADIVSDTDSKRSRIGEGIRFWIILAEDLLYSLICAVIISITVFHLNTGHPRWFILLGAAVGFALYYHTVGRIVMLLSSGIILIIKTVVLFIFKITLFPVFRLFRILAFIILVRARARVGRMRSGAITRRMLARSEDGFGLYAAVFARR